MPGPEGIKLNNIAINLKDVAQKLNEITNIEDKHAVLAFISEISTLKKLGSNLTDEDINELKNRCKIDEIRMKLVLQTLGLSQTGNSQATLLTAVNSEANTKALNSLSQSNQKQETPKYMGAFTFNDPLNKKVKDFILVFNTKKNLEYVKGILVDAKRLMIYRLQKDKSHAERTFSDDLLNKYSNVIFTVSTINSNPTFNPDKKNKLIDNVFNKLTTQEAADLISLLESVLAK
jgi:hypothetical protein